MTRLFQRQLPISRVDWEHLTDFIQGQDILLGLHPEHENFKPTEGSTTAKDYYCLTQGCSMQFTNKGSAHSHIQVAILIMGLFCPLDWARWLQPMVWSLSESVSILKTPGSWHFIWVRAFRGRIQLILPIKGQHKICHSHSGFIVSDAHCWSWRVGCFTWFSCQDFQLTWPTLSLTTSQMTGPDIPIIFVFTFVLKREMKLYYAFL